MNKKQTLITLFMVSLIVLLPLASALSITDINATDVSETSATITWLTDEQASSVLSYGKTTSLTNSELDNNLKQEHSITLSDLNDTTKYYFSVTSQNENGAIIDDNSGQFYSFTTLTQETSTPSLSLDELPAYVGGRFDISGTTDPNTKVVAYVNGVSQRKATANEEGEFSLNNIEASVFTNPNIIKIEAGNTNQEKTVKTFEVRVDKTSPNLELTTKIPSVTSKTDVKIKATVSENSTIQIYLNDDLVFDNEETTSLDEEISLEEGENNIKIKAIDKANNSVEITKNIYSDTEPPEIEITSPKSGSFFYEGATITDIEGDTEPFAKVELLLKTGSSDEAGRRELASTTADENGHFLFEDINIEGGYALSGRAGYIGTDALLENSTYIPTQYSQEAKEDSEIDSKDDEVDIALYVVVTDRIGLKAEKRLSYTVGTCFSGGMDWNVINVIEYQSPTMLSPERLAEGTELITFVLKLNYQGYGDNPEIKDIKFEKACDADSMKTDIRYNYSCQILSTRPTISRSNDNKSLWYVRYNLKQLEGMDKFSEDMWEDLSKQFVFPLKIKIQYTDQEYKNISTKWQTKCMNFAFHVDTSRIDPREVLPDWLREDTLDMLNESIEALNEIIPEVEKVLKYSAIACIVGFALKVIAVIYRRWQGWWEYLQDKTIDEDDSEKCPKPANQYNSENTDEGRTQADLTDEELETRCPLTSQAWKTESQLYQAYRWTCDRFLCKGTPARWTEEALPVAGRAVGEDTVFEQIRNGLSCTEQTGTKGIILREDKKCTIRVNKQCWEYEGKTYAYSGDTIEKGKETLYELVPIDEKTGVEKIGKKLNVIKKGSAVMIEEPDEKACKKLCEEKDYKNSECIDPLSFTKEKLEDDEANQIFNTEDCSEDGQLCYCYSDRDEKIQETDTEGTWNYRYEKIKRVYYSPYFYYQGRDQSACFGQNNYVFRSDPYLDPKDAIPAFQCLCISQIRNRLVLLRNILTGSYNCLKQIDKTGKANAGVCKEVFTQYLCKWSYKLISYFMGDCAPWQGIGQETKVGDYIRAGTDSIYGGLEESTNDLLDDYNNAALQDYLGVGEGAVAEKICLGALTGDWGFDLEGLMDAAYLSPFHTSITAWPADREYLTWNPDNEMATYEYRTAWTIASGCKIDSYSVELSCVTDHELYNYDGVSCPSNSNTPGGCDCASIAGSNEDQDEPGPSRVIYRGGSLSQGEFEDQSIHFLAEDPIRYDNIKVTINVNDQDMAEQCIPDENRQGRQGVFYFPIADATTKDIIACRFDQSTGSFRCSHGDLLWEAKGRAYFGDVKCSGEICDGKTYYLGESILLDPLDLYANGERQCLYAQIKNQAGESLLGGKDKNGLFTEININEDKPGEWVTKKNPMPLIGEITSDLFRNVRPDVTLNPSALIQLTSWDRGGVGERTYNLYLIDSDRNGVADKYSVDNTNSKLDLVIPYTVSTGDVIFRFSDPSSVKVTSDSTCSGISEPCKTYEITTKPRSQTAGENIQDWKIILQLRHLPGEDNDGYCTESTESNIISYQGNIQEREFRIKVNPSQKPKDTQPPTISDIKLNNAIISTVTETGTPVTVAVTASDDVGISNINLYVDNVKSTKTVWTPSFGTKTGTWTRQVELDPGSHYLLIEVNDAEPSNPPVSVSKTITIK